MIDLIAIAQSSPGAIAINSSIIIGYELAGSIGAGITLLWTVLPPLIIVSIISLFYIVFRDNLIVNEAMKGMQAGVAGLSIVMIGSGVAGAIIYNLLGVVWKKYFGG